MSILQQLLGELPSELFLQQHWLTSPFALADSAIDFAELGSWDVLDSLLSQPDVDVLIVKEGRRRHADQPLSPTKARELFQSGHTILVRHAERFDDRLADLAEQFHCDFDAPVDVHLYATPAESFGFGWHYDAEEVFIVQTMGEKEYSLRKNTVNPWPLVETLPEDMRYERELMPLIQCLLHAGDWLYIPGGYWHRAAANTDSISLAIGVMMPSGMDIFDHLRARLLSSPIWRRRLPVTGSAQSKSQNELIERYKELFADLASDLSREMCDEAAVRSFLNSRDA